MKLRAEEETDTYISETGYYCIKQSQEDNDVIVCLSPSQVTHIITDMKKRAKLLSEHWEEDIEQSMKEDHGTD